jgi:hypothetical protein
MMDDRDRLREPGIEQRTARAAGARGQVPVISDPSSPVYLTIC